MKRLLIILLLLPLSMAAQTLSGRVVDEKNTPLYPVTVVNVSTQKTTITSKDGLFSIPVKDGQQVVFSFIGYDVTEYIVSAGTPTQNIKINMHPLSYKLNEFVLRPKYTPYQIDSIEKQRIYAPALSRTHSSVMSPVSFVAERLSGRSKQIFRFQKSLTQWENSRFIDTRYTRPLVQQLTNLSGDTLGYFMSIHPMEYDFARAATELELKMWIRYNYRTWREKGSPVDSSVFNLSIEKPE